MKDKIKVYSSDGSENHAAAVQPKPAPILFKREALYSADREFGGRFEDLRARGPGEKHPFEEWLNFQGLSVVVNFSYALGNKSKALVVNICSTTFDIIQTLIKTLIIHPLAWCFSTIGQLTFTGVQTFADSLREVTHNLFTWLKAWAQQGFRRLLAPWKALVNLFSKNYANLISFLCSIGLLWDQSKQRLFNFLENFLAFIQEQWEIFMGAGTNKMEVWQAFFFRVAIDFQESFGRRWQQISNFLSPYLSRGSHKASIIFNRMMMATQSFIESVADALVEGGKALIQHLHLGLVVVKEFLLRLWKKNLDYMSVLSGYLSEIKKIFQIKRSFREIFLKLQSLVKAPLVGIKNGLKHLSEKWLPHLIDRVRVIALFLYQKIKASITPIARFCWFLLLQTLIFISSLFYRGLFVFKNISVSFGKKVYQRIHLWIQKTFAKR